MERMPPVANVVISNVPGPQVPLYLAGAQMKTFFPVSIITHGLALNITVQTYCGRIDFGIIACKEAVPDLHDFATAIAGGFDELVALAEAKVALETERGEALEIALNAPLPVATKTPKPKAKAAPKVAAKAAPKATVTIRAKRKPASKPTSKTPSAKNPAAFEH